MGAQEIRAFLTCFATNRGVSASTQNQALSSVLFLYRDVLHIEIGRIENVPHARMPVRVPVILSRDEVARIMKRIDGVAWIIVALLYGASLRLQECLELRVKDIDLERRRNLIRHGKGQKDPPTVLPRTVIEPLLRHLEAVQPQHQADLAPGFGRVVLPFALDRKYANAPTDWAWEFVFPAPGFTDPRWGPPNRFHVHESVVQKALAPGGTGSGRHQTCGPTHIPHSFAAHLLEDGYDIRTVQELLGRARTSARRWCTRTCSIADHSVYAALSTGSEVRVRAGREPWRPFYWPGPFGWTRETVDLQRVGIARC